MRSKKSIGHWQQINKSHKILKNEKQSSTPVFETLRTNLVTGTDGSQWTAQTMPVSATSWGVPLNTR
eukprot:m.203277 g.203277  ORF g.203277 m.203277 type:complete len:67 (-) comp26001_c0_seq1:2663-2863(-)